MWNTVLLQRGQRHGAQQMNRSLLHSGGAVHKPLRVLVANTKGGCGKTTVAINLACQFAASDHHTVLIDHDSQGSSMHWLEGRSNLMPSIYGIDCHRQGGRVTRTFAQRLPPESERVILDAPAGVGGFPLYDMLREVDVVLVPVLASSIDIHAAHQFITELNKLPRVRAGVVRVGVIANRVRENTKAYQLLEKFLQETGVPVVAHLRDAQIYVQAADEGVGVVELKSRSSYSDRRQWRQLVDWLEQGYEE